MYAKVGRTTSGIRKLTLELKAKGYTTHLVLNEIPIEKAFQRNIGRYNETGRLVPPDYLLSVGNQPIRTYVELEKEGIFDDYERYSNDVRRGDVPIRVNERSGAHSGGEATVGVLPGRQGRRVSGPGLDGERGF